MWEYTSLLKLEDLVKLVFVAGWKHWFIFKELFQQSYGKGTPSVRNENSSKLHSSSRIAFLVAVFSASINSKGQFFEKLFNGFVGVFLFIWLGFFDTSLPKAASSVLI